MSLADLEAPQRRVGTRPCSLKQWIDTLSPDDARAVRVALLRDKADPFYWSSPKLYERLVLAGWTGSDAVITSHRKPGCISCR